MQPADLPDPLASILGLLRPRSVFSKIIRGAGEWSVRYEPYADPGFCLVLDGSCFLAVEGQPAIELQPGDFVLLPDTPAFTMATDLALPPRLLPPTNPGELLHGDPEAAANLAMLGGYFHFDRANAHLLVKLLPALVHIRSGEEGADRLGRTVQWIADEATADRPGRELILERLAEVLLVEALRFRSRKEIPEQGLLAGLADPNLARALREMHVDVARRWTVEGLARKAAMSRAVFAERFNRKVGLPPMEYLLEWRMAIAKDLLRTARPPLAEVAERIGYQSASAFSTAFTRIAGCPPSEFARQAS